MAGLNLLWFPDGEAALVLLPGRLKEESGRTEGCDVKSLRADGLDGFSVSGFAGGVDKTSAEAAGLPDSRC